MNTKGGRNRKDIINKKLKYYRRAWEDFPARFKEMSDELIIKIWGYLGEPQDLLRFLSTEKYLSRFRNHNEIWKQCFETWYWHKPSKTSSHPSDLCKLESSFAENPITGTLLTYKGLIWDQFELLKSFCWKETPVEASKSNPSTTSSHDRLSSVYCYPNILLPSSNSLIQTKLIYIPESKYFLIVLHQSKIEIYSVLTSEKKLQLWYQSESEESIQCRVSKTSPQYIVILKDTSIIRLNLLDLDSMSDEPCEEVISQIPLLENTETVKNFILPSRTELMAQTSRGIKIFDINSEKFTFEVEIQNNQVTLV